MRIAIIPARGGSKRIPRKNIRNFLGKPIIAYSIEAALNSKLFDVVMVSTDDDEIASVARDYGATVPFRRSIETSSDFASTFDVIEEVIAEYCNLGLFFKEICCIYACAPFVTEHRLLESHRLMQSEGFDSIFPVMVFGFPIQRALKFNSGKIEYVNPENSLVRSQDLEKCYHDAGQFYWLSEKVIIEKSIVTRNSWGLVISDMEGQDIDNEEDWQIAELKYGVLQRFRNTEI